MKNIKLIITDLDNTLLRSDKTVSGYTRTILERCRENAILLAYATARPERATRHLGLGGLVSYVIANNGATITRGESCIRNIYLPEAVKHGIITRFTQHNDISAITVEADGLLYTNDADHKVWSSSAGWNPVYTDFSAPVEGKAVKIAFACHDLHKALDIIKEYHDIKVVSYSGEMWHSITHCSVSKYEAITYLSDLTGIKNEDIAAFGDDHNDVEMIQKCGIGVAVENAIPEVKAAADYICGSNDADGPAKWIEQHIL